MTREFPTDPEIAADLIHRARSERDPNRTRESANPFSGPIVERWPCRGRCGAQVGVTQAAVDALETFNRALRAKREPELDRHRLAFCSACRERDLELERLQRQRDRDTTPRQRELGFAEPEERPSGMKPQRRRSP